MWGTGMVGGPRSKGPWDRGSKGPGCLWEAGEKRTGSVIPKVAKTRRKFTQESPQKGQELGIQGAGSGKFRPPCLPPPPPQVLLPPAHWNDSFQLESFQVRGPYYF